MVDDPDVLDAVSRLLEREGLAGLTITAIAEEAALSRVTLHRRGRRIDDLVIAVLRRASDDLRASLWPVLTSSDDAAVRMRHALTLLCEVSERHAGALAAFYRTPAWPLPDRPDSTTSFQFIEPLDRILRDGISEGTLESDDPRADATLAANAVMWTYLHMRRAHGWSVEDATTRVVSLTMASLLPG